VDAAAAAGGATKPADTSRTLIGSACRSVALSLRSSFITRIYAALAGRGVPDGIRSEQ
jgi:hypothetical protein